MKLLVVVKDEDGVDECEFEWGWHGGVLFFLKKLWQFNVSRTAAVFSIAAVRC
jgi:hypothetical protein